MKKAKHISMIMIGILSCVLFLTGVSASDTDSSANASFLLEGKEYTLPIDFSELTADGWTTTTDVEHELGSMTETAVHMRKEGTDDSCWLDTYVFNGSDNTKKIKDCQICMVMITRSSSEGISFELSNGLKPGDDQAAVSGIMGEPDDSSDDDMAAVVSYGHENVEGRITFCWFKEEAAKASDYIMVGRYQTVETETS